MESKYSHLILAVFLIFAPFAHAAKPATETQIASLQKDLIALSAGEKERDEAAKRLRAEPPRDVSRALLLQLQESSSQLFALRALNELGREFRTPEIEKAVLAIAKKSNSYEVFDSINSSIGARPEGAEKELNKLYLNRLKSLLGTKKNSPLKSALLSGLAKLGEPLTDAIFDSLLVDADFNVRESVVKHFLATRESLSQTSQAMRFRKSLKAQPYQTRLVAMEAFAQLPLPELKALAQSFDEAQCKTEKFEATRTACEQVRESLKKTGMK